MQAKQFPEKKISGKLNAEEWLDPFAVLQRSRRLQTFHMKKESKNY
jgi:hypothetical protein